MESGYTLRELASDRSDRKLQDPSREFPAPPQAFDGLGAAAILAPDDYDAPRHSAAAVAASTASSEVGSAAGSELPAADEPTAQELPVTAPEAPEPLPAAGGGGDEPPPEPPLPPEAADGDDEPQISPVLAMGGVYRPGGQEDGLQEVGDEEAVAARHFAVPQGTTLVARLSPDEDVEISALPTPEGCVVVLRGGGGTGEVGLLHFGAADEQAHVKQRITEIIEAVPSLGAPGAAAVVVGETHTADHVGRNDMLRISLGARGLAVTVVAPHDREVAHVTVRVPEPGESDGVTVYNTLGGMLYPESEDREALLAALPRQFVAHGYEGLPAVIGDLPKGLSLAEPGGATDVLPATYEDKAVVIKTPVAPSSTAAILLQEQQTAVAERARALLLGLSVAATEDSVEKLVVYDLTDANDLNRSYVVTEHLPGKSLSELSVSEFAAISEEHFETVARVITKLHEAGCQIDSYIHNFPFSSEKGFAVLDYADYSTIDPSEQFGFFLADVFSRILPSSSEQRAAALSAFEKGLQVLDRLYPEIRSSGSATPRLIQECLQQTKEILTG